MPWFKGLNGIIHNPIGRNTKTPFCTDKVFDFLFTVCNLLSIEKNNNVRLLSISSSSSSFLMLV